MNKLRLILSAALIAFCGMVYAQDINEAGEALNNGNSFIKAKKFALAIEEYKNCIDLCNEIGDDAYELSEKAKTALNIAYIGLGKAQYKAKKFDDALAAFTTAYESETDEAKKKKTKAYIAKVLNSKGLALYKAKKYDEAIAVFDKSFENDETYVKAIYGKSLVYRKQGNIELFKAAVDQILEIGPAYDKKTVARTAKMVKGFFTAEGGKAIQSGKFKKATELLEMGFAYGPAKAQAHYFAAIAYNGIKNWNKAIENANKALALEKKSKSNINFELGKAYEGQGNKAKAIAAYRKVVDGANLDAAKHKINHELK